NGVQVVDLADRGALLTGWAGEPVGADLSPDGATLVVSTQTSVDLVRVADGSRWTYAGTPELESLRYFGSGRSAMWLTASEISLVETATLRAVRIPREGRPLVAASDDGARIVVGRAGNDETPGSVALVAFGEGRPRSVIFAGKPADVRISRDGAKVA